MVCLIPPDDLAQFKLINKIWIKLSFNGTIHMFHFPKPSKKLGCPGMPCLTPARIWIITPLFLLFNLDHSRSHTLESIQDTRLANKFLAIVMSVPVYVDPSPFH